VGIKQYTCPFNLNLPRMGYFICYRHKKGWIGDAISKAQRAKGFSDEDSLYTHVEVSGGGPNAVCVAPPKTRIVDIRKKYKGRHIKIMAYEGYYGNRKRYKVAFWSASKSNLQYDFLGILSFVTKLVSQARSRFFCSENCLWSLQKEFDWALNLAPADCMPAHFVLSDDMICVWEGDIP